MQRNPVRWIVRLFGTALILYLLTLGLAMTLSERLIFLPPAPSYKDSAETLKLRTADGENISAVFLPHPGAQFTLLFSHGNAEDLGYVRSDLERFRTMGFSVLAYDYRGYGTSEGAPSEKAAYHDIDAAYDYLTGTLGIPAARIVAYGRSLGGGPSVELASHRELGGLVLESTFVTAFRVVTRLSLLPFDRFRNIDKLPQVHCPVLLMHGTADRVIAYWHAPALLRAAHEPKQLWTVKDGGHLELMEAPGFEQTLREFVEKLPGAGGR